MKSRCCTLSDGDYSSYGARVCDAWLASFDTFRDWSVAHGYTAKLTLDRIDVNGPYSPENCRWVSMKDKRNTVYITFNGVTRSASEWAEQLGVSVDAVHRRTGTPYTQKQLEAGLDADY